MALLNPPLIAAERRRAFRLRLQTLYAAMDRAYARVAESCGFTCSGCRDNCCRSRFHHHTVIEYLELQNGLDQLPPDQRQRVEALARQAIQTAPDRRVPCPLLADERCLLYAHRPMICRLHGIPHRLVRPDGTVLAGDGCAAFHARCGPATRRLDRTPFYRQMADLEKELRAETGFPARVKLTVAEMIAAMATEADEP
jgi:hypothetical protein